MAKGDRDIFKADTDDGFTKIADLLLETLAMAKLNGVQKGICLFLWRRTYGWKQKEDQISLKDFAQACDSEESYVSKQLKQLVKWNVVLRTSYQPGKIPTYLFNTRVDQWDKGCLNRQGLSDRTNAGLYVCFNKKNSQYQEIQGVEDCKYQGRVVQKDKGCPKGQGLSDQTKQGLSDQTRVDQGPDIEPQGFEPPLYTYDRHINNNTNIFKAFEKEFGRPLSPIEIEKISQWIEQASPELVHEALKRAVLNGKWNFRYIDTILLEWKKNNLRTIPEIEQYDAGFKNRVTQKGEMKGGAKPREPSGDRRDSGASDGVDWNKFFVPGAGPPQV